MVIPGSPLEVLNKHKSFFPKYFVDGELGVPPDISKAAWQVNFLTLGISFLLLSFFVLLSIFKLIQDNREKKFMRRNYFLLVNVALLYFSLTTAVTKLVDPYEHREYMKPRAARQFIHLLIRLRIPCLALAFALVQTSLLNITEIRAYATRFHNIVLIYTSSAIHFALVTISTGATMFGGNYGLVYLLCEVYTFVLFFCYTAVSFYTGIKILTHYRKNMHTLRKVISTSGSWYRSAYGHDNDAAVLDDDMLNEQPAQKSLDTEKSLSAERDVYVCENTDKPSIIRSDTADSMVPVLAKRQSQFPIYIDDDKKDKKHKVICDKRRMGSMPYQTHTSKFADKSIVKVTSLMVVVSICGTVLCTGIAIALFSAAHRYMANIHHGHMKGLEGWRWYMLRSVLRLSELGADGTMAYMVRRTVCC